MSHTHRSEGRQADHQQRQPGTANHRKDDGYEQYKTDPVEQRDADDKAGQSHRPGHLPRAECCHQGVGNPLGGTAFDHEFAEHCPGHDHNRKPTKNVANAFPDGSGNLCHGHPEREGRTCRDQDKGQKGMHPRPDDEHHEQPDGNGDNRKAHAGAISASRLTSRRVRSASSE